MKKLICLISLCAISSDLFSQIGNHKIKEFFKLCFYFEDGSVGYYSDSDSLKNSEIDDFGENMYAFSQYLLANYTDAGNKENGKEIEKVLPDTTAATTIFNKYLEGDTVFSQLYFDFLIKKEIPDIHIDSLVNITCRF